MMQDPSPSRGVVCAVYPPRLRAQRASSSPADTGLPPAFRQTLCLIPSKVLVPSRASLLSQMTFKKPCSSLNFLTCLSE